LLGEGLREDIKIFPTDTEPIIIDNKGCELSNISIIQTSKTYSAHCLIWIFSGLHEFRSSSFTCSNKGIRTSGIILAASTGFRGNNCKLAGFYTGIGAQSDSEIVMGNSFIRDCEYGVDLSGARASLETCKFEGISDTIIILSKSYLMRQPKKRYYPYLSMKNCNILGNGDCVGFYFSTTDKYYVELKNCFLTKLECVCFSTDRITVFADNCQISGNTKLSPISEGVLFLGENNYIQH
jgi:hypothetical protein